LFAIDNSFSAEHEQGISVSPGGSRVHTAGESVSANDGEDSFLVGLAGAIAVLKSPCVVLELPEIAQNGTASLSTIDPSSTVDVNPRRSESASLGRNISVNLGPGVRGSAEVPEIVKVFRRCFSAKEIEVSIIVGPRHGASASGGRVLGGRSANSGRARHEDPRVGRGVVFP
jgi:hypothetical protein